ncbi:hypothetical protein J2W32_004121 [Variovorax boronicumulans]|nr:hypothetical protein [Variovorax boronicumulans]MDQ0002245.1 hypothetical protein [Variovorax boronicumulans]MDQ0055063.1 hypothetical protein [Variovorax boronicumulans]
MKEKKNVIGEPFSAFLTALRKKVRNSSPI